MLITRETEQLRHTIQRAHERLREIEDAEREDRNATLVGKYFRFRNSYSCPDTADDYWWLYLHITGISENGWLEYWSFEQDSLGKTIIYSNQSMSRVTSDYQKISASHFWSRWCDILEYLCAYHQRRK